MKRQRRTLGLLLAGLSIALGVIGRQSQPSSQSRSIAARSAMSAKAAQRDALNRPVSTGNLAWLISDPRCSIGAQEVLRINAEEDGLSRRADAVASRRAQRRYPSWLWPAWAAYSVWDASSDRTLASLFDHGPLHCGARLARQATSLLSPWPSRLAGQSEAAMSESIRVSRLPNPAAPENARPQAASGGDLSAASNLVL